MLAELEVVVPGRFDAKYYYVCICDHVVDQYSTSISVSLHDSIMRFSQTVPISLLAILPVP